MQQVAVEIGSGLGAVPDVVDNGMACTRKLTADLMGHTCTDQHLQKRRGVALLNGFAERLRMEYPLGFAPFAMLNPPRLEIHHFALG